ncbi:RIP metalloprotease RseP [Acidisoma sp. 7E03]
MHDLVSLLRTLVSFAVVLGVLVFVHEMGHYLAARWRGVHVETFSIGFGQAIARWTDKRGTVWKLAWLPLGGYVKLHGQERPQDVTEEERASWQAGRTFQEKSVWSRMIVIAAGPIANFILAAVLFIGLFMVVGKPIAEPVIGKIMPGSAASQVKLKPGDVITSVGGVPVKDFLQIQKQVEPNPGKDVGLTVLRGDATYVFRVKIGQMPDGHGGERGVLGIVEGQPHFKRLAPQDAVVQGVVETWTVGRQTLEGLWQIVAHRTGLNQLGGPLRIASLSGQVAAMGIASLVSFIAVLSVNLGLINLFPIPVLDGGHLLFYLAEVIRGRPISPKAQEYGFRAGFALLLCLFVFATWNDVNQLGVVRWVAHLAG